MRIGVPAESRPGETLVAATPKTVGQLVGLGYDVVVESGAGAKASYPDAAFAEAGAQIGSPEEAWRADLVLKVRSPTDEEIARLRPGQTLAALLQPALNPEVLDKLREAGVTALAMDAVPRISRAQSMDVLSSQANLAGYRAVIEAAHEFGGLFTGQVTAAGKMPPARVFVIGAGVAGLAAIGAANSLGAIVRAYDVRPEVAEQVESMGAEFVRVEGAEQEVSADGYAKEMTPEQQELVLAMYADEAAQSDIVVTTALIPGRPAPQLLSAEAVAAMKPGSVIVDMAAANGGNVEPSRADELVLTPNGVKVLGWTDLAGRLPTQASQLYGTNLVNLLKLTTPNKDGHLTLDFEDPVQRSITVTHGGDLLWPPPPVTVSAAPAPAPAPAPEPLPEKEKRPPNPVLRGVVMVVLAGLFLWMSAVSPAGFLGHLTVFVLAVVVGYYVIWNVVPALHTPLMAETNAISGIILVGALLQVGDSNTVVTVISFIAIVVASINIFGGFLVANRMLAMFRKD
ncbi:MAG: Re/Si-specific NAD(P)(+) transhydrogenase subunit alpha [Actinomycetales bacterium]